MTPASLTAGTPTYQVSELASLIRGLLEDTLSSVWVEGEISSFSRPASGHWYFTLKDSSAQLRCAMFKNRNLYVRPIPAEGDRVRVRAKVDFYPGRGDLQLICEALEAAGEGALLAALERLKKKLAAEGLFDATLKRALPERPRQIGVITSGTGAAVEDIKATLARRWPFATVWLWPVPVQGTDAPPAIVKALQQLPAKAPVELVLLARGGGSLEDLMAFNDEGVVRAVRACTVPVITGVGHEVDVTLVDFASDLRAPTPTAAAELATPKLEDWLLRAAEAYEALQQAMQEGLANRQRDLRHVLQRLRPLHPGRRLQDRQQRLDELSQRLQDASLRRLTRLREQGTALSQRLLAASPARHFAARQRVLDGAQQRLLSATVNRHHRLHNQLGSLTARLAALDPEAVLGRGYAIALTADGHVARDAAALKAGDALQLRLARGRVETTVKRTLP